MLQVLPLASLMYPSSPHSLPQEFLISQQSSVTPTSNTAWSEIPVGPLQIPPLQSIHSLAQTDTATGPFCSCCTSALQSRPCCSQQFWMVATEGQEQQGLPYLFWPAVQGSQQSEVIPLLLQMNSKAVVMEAPQQVATSGLPQSTNCSSERSKAVLELMRQALSTAAAPAKAQQQPQPPWFLTEVTLPSETQLMLLEPEPEGEEERSSWSASASALASFFGLGFDFGRGPFRFRISAASSSVRSENWLTPFTQVAQGSVLCFLISSSYYSKICFLWASSEVAYFFWKSFLQCSKVQSLQLERSWQESTYARTQGTNARMRKAAKAKYLPISKDIYI